MPRGIQTHVAFYVKDLDETVRKWKKLLAILDPEVRNPQTAHWERAFKTLDELI